MENTRKELSNGSIKYVHKVKITVKTDSKLLLFVVVRKAYLIYVSEDLSVHL
ncbi:hypothetical protein [Ekhidna sp.]|uniref:hypothetical protein n=1 Tax=Ekhidna sp. TaxID=2608089 RepID=UPI00329794D0